MLPHGYPKLCPLACKFAHSDIAELTELPPIIEAGCADLLFNGASFVLPVFFSLESQDYYDYAGNGESLLSVALGEVTVGGLLRSPSPSQSVTLAGWSLTIG